MTDHDKPSDSSIGQIQTLSMDEFNRLVCKTKPARTELTPAMLDFLKQYEVVNPDDSHRPVI